MISRTAIKKFLAGKHDDFSQLKLLKEADVDDMLMSLSPRPIFDIKRPLRLHQKVCFLIGIAYPCWYFALEMGLGKTRVVLELFDYRYRLGEVVNGLILVPTDTIVESWREQVEEWKPHLPITKLLDSTEKKFELLLAHRSGLVAATYAGFGWMTSDLVLPKKATKRRLVKNNAMVDDIAGLFDTVTLDEATVVSERTSLIFDICSRLSKTIPSRYLLAGRPFGKNPLKLWGQYYLIDRGDTLGETLGLFRDAFFTKKRSRFGGAYSFDYTFKKDMADKLNEFLGHRSLVYTANECLDLPPVTLTRRIGRLPVATLEYYRAIVKQAKDAKQRQNLFIRLRQLASGFLGVVDDETGDKAEVEFAHNPKLDMLMDDVHALPPGKKMLIFHEFTWTGRRICRELERAGVTHGWIWGGTDDFPILKHRFDNDPKFTVLVLNTKKGVLGLNLQRASYTAVVESPLDPIMRAQMVARTVRDGQKAQRVFVRDYLIKGTMDEAILEAIKNGNNLYAQIMKQPRLLENLLGL